MKRAFAAGMLSPVTALTFSVGAFAADSRSGYKECNPGRQFRLTSNTGDTASAPFFVRHEVGSKYKTWSSPGTHTWHSGTPGGYWQVITNGIIFGTPGTSCV